jgi:hypothetical protein
LSYFYPFEYDKKKDVTNDLMGFGFGAIQRHRADPIFSMTEFRLASIAAVEIIPPTKPINA